MEDTNDGDVVVEENDGNEAIRSRKHGGGTCEG